MLLLVNSCVLYMKSAFAVCVVVPTRTDDGYWRIKTRQEIIEILKEQI